MAYARRRADRSRSCWPRRATTPRCVTRNFIFDGSIPGIMRGFRHNTLPSPMPALASLRALPRRRASRASGATSGARGFFHPAQQQSRRFLSTFARALMPADRLALDHVLERHGGCTGTPERPYFLFCQSLRRPRPLPAGAALDPAPVWTPRGCVREPALPVVMPRLGSHTYLQPGFRLSEIEPPPAARPLPPRHRADGREAARLLRGGARRRAARRRPADRHQRPRRGLRRARISTCTTPRVYDTHLHVPLWIHHPEDAPGWSTTWSARAICSALIRAVGRGEPISAARCSTRAGAPSTRSRWPSTSTTRTCADMQPRYRQNVTAAIAGTPS